jgi:hypothetical protein
VYGGGYAGAGTTFATFVDSLFHDNTAVVATNGGNLAGRGGAIYNENGASLTLERTLVRNNVAEETVLVPGDTGGGLVCDSCRQLRIANSIFAENSAAPGASGAWLRTTTTVDPALPPVQLSIDAATFIDNTMKSGPALFLKMTQGAVARVTNVAAWSSAAAAPARGPMIGYANANDVQVSYSLWGGRPAPCPSTCGTGVLDADPLLSKSPITPPAGQLGPDFVWGPGAGSPVLGAGTNVGAAAKDFLGNPRVGGDWRRGLGRVIQLQGVAAAVKAPPTCTAQPQRGLHSPLTASPPPHPLRPTLPPPGRQLHRRHRRR